MSEMIERVAKQLHETLSSQDINGYLDANFDLHAVARATIEAMREPTGQMRIEFEGWNCSANDMEAVYQAAIDAALKETV